MQPRVHVITLAVDDLERAVTFYRDGLGLPTDGIIGTEFLGDDERPAGAVAMFHLAVYPRTELLKDAHLAATAIGDPAFSLGHAVPSRDAVDALLERAVSAGATSTGSAHDRPWGIYSGYFKDPDGHLWEVMWNPRLPIG
jgi:uncharacterized protein